jgi:hypothetical protein
VGAAGTAVDCPGLSTLIRQLDTELAPGVPLTLIVPEILAGLDAERLQLSRRVTWQVVDGAMPAAEMRPTTLGFELPAGSDPALRYLQAAAAALKPAGAPDLTVVVHLAPGPLPDRLRAAIGDGATLLAGPAVTGVGAGTVVWRDTDGQPLATLQRIGRGRLYRFTRPLSPAAMPVLLDPDFPRQLAAMLAPPALPTRAMARDMMPGIGAAAWPVPARDLRPWLDFALTALFLVERFLATRRRRAVSP